MMDRQQSAELEFKFRIIAHLEMGMVLSTIAMHEVTSRPATLAAKRAHVTRGGGGGGGGCATAAAATTTVDVDAPASMDFKVGAVGDAGSCAPEPAARLDTWFSMSGEVFGRSRKPSEAQRRASESRARTVENVE